MADDSQSGNPAAFQTPFDLQVAKTPNFINAAYSTPAQRAELYAYANAMLKPQPIKNGWQGLASIARALVGGYASHLADQYEAQNYAHNMGQTTPGADAPVSGEAANYAPAAAGGAGGESPAPAPSAPLASPLASAASLGAGTAWGTDHVNAGAASAGVNPDARGMRNNNPGNLEANSWTATLPGYKGSDGRFAIFDTPEHGAAALDRNLSSYASKGISTPHDIAATWAPGSEKGNNPNSYGAQIASGLGVAPNDPIDLSDPNVRAKVASSIARVENGPGKGSFSAYAAPAAHAIGAALAGGAAPVQVAQNLPFTPRQLGAMAANPNLPDHIRSMAMQLTQPHLMTDALGNVIPVQQGSQAGPPVARLGAAQDVTLPGNIPGRAIYTGTPERPNVQTLTPAGNLGGGANGWTPEAMDKLRGLAAAGQGIEAQGGVLKSKAEMANARFQATQEAQWKLQQAAQPLLQIKNVMDQNGGQLPTGKGAEKLLDFASAANMIGTLIGHPITNEDSKLTGLELMRKYGNQVAASLTGHNTDAGLHAAESMSPGIGLSQASNEHLIDNYLRLNQLAQKRAQFERDYYLSHGGASNPNVYDNFNNDWQAAITGKNAIPLAGEKYGRKIEYKGKPYIVVPSTDTKGYSVYPPGAIAEVSTP